MTGLTRGTGNSLSRKSLNTLKETLKSKRESEGAKASRPKRAIVGRPLHTTELYLAKQRIEKVRGLSDFPNLEVLYLNQNKLTHISHLDTNFRIRELYLQDNQIRTLKGSLKHLKFLEVLNLGNNQLRDLHATIEDLVHLSFLQRLTLADNPIAGEHNYRAFVIHKMPSVTVLDHLGVTRTEREHSQSLYRPQAAATTAFGGKRVPVATRPIEKVSAITRELERDVQRQERQRKQAEEKETAACFEEAEQRSRELVQMAQQQRLPPPPGWVRPQQGAAITNSESSVASVAIVTKKSLAQDHRAQEEARATRHGTGPRTRDVFKTSLIREKTKIKADDAEQLPTTLGSNKSKLRFDRDALVHARHAVTQKKIKNKEVGLGSDL